MSAAVSDPPPTATCGPTSELLSCIDLSKLSQSELRALSLCSGSAVDIRRTDDVVVPNIDRSLFNESAGSRRQTYSKVRLRRHSHHHHHHRTRLPGLLLPADPKTKPPSDDPESHAILHYLKYYLNNGQHSAPPPPPPPPPRESSPLLHPPVSNREQTGSGSGEKSALVVQSNEKKRKRGRKPKNALRVQENGTGLEFLVNRNGEAIDLVALESRGDELFSDELRRRTYGLEGEEQVLGFLRDLEGQWCSRRKKRKYVDASDFADILPVGWKLLLGLRRKEGRVWIYCRRYISPAGQQFLSCKEASSFLTSSIMNNNANLPSDERNPGIRRIDGGAEIVSGNVSKTTEREEEMNTQEMNHDSNLASFNTSSEREIEVSLLGIDNLPDVHVEDLFECYKCNLAFDDKNSYLQHLVAYHQQTTRRYQFDSPIGEGVVIKDGTLECQFCHKLFDERHTYDAHVGIHMKNSATDSEPLSETAAMKRNVEPVTLDELPRMTSKMDALIEIAQNSFLETRRARSFGDPNPVSPLEEVSVSKIDGTKDSNFDHCEMDTTEACKSNPDADQELSMHDTAMVERDMVEIKSEEYEANEVTSLGGTKKHLDVEYLGKQERHDLERGGSPELEMSLGSWDGKPNNNDVSNNKGLSLEEFGTQHGVVMLSGPMAQSPFYFSAFDAASDKMSEGIELSDDGQKVQNLTGFEELRLDETEPFKYSFEGEQGSSNLPGMCVDLRNESRMDDTLSGGGFEMETGIIDMEASNMVTTVCVWCTSKFNLQTIDSDTQSDSIGFMCPNCKAKISGHLESSLSMNSQGF